MDDPDLNITGPDPRVQPPEPRGQVDELARQRACLIAQVQRLRVALGRAVRERREIEARADSDHDTGGGFIDFGDYIESVTGLDTATLRACIDEAKDADGVGGAS